MIASFKYLTAKHTSQMLVNIPQTTIKQKCSFPICKMIAFKKSEGLQLRGIVSSKNTKHWDYNYKNY